jgi:8-oxo-dGTP pyrophosphatase MutT (NUDIX family)
VADAHDELLDVFDAEGRVVGALPRSRAKASGLAVGAVNVLLVNGRGELLLQLRPDDKENGGLWDKSVGGHVGAGESFDRTARREVGEELFCDPGSPRVVLAADEAAYRALLADGPGLRAVFRRVALQLNLRDVRHAPGRTGLRNVTYHVAIYLGRCDLPLSAFAPQAEEIAGLRHLAPAEVDRLLVEGRLAPNMAFLWLAVGHRVVAELPSGAGGGNPPPTPS